MLNTKFFCKYFILKYDKKIYYDVHKLMFS